jgi:hypothetical protein
LAAALTATLHDASLHRRVRNLAEAVQREDGVGKAVEIVSKIRKISLATTRPIR